jgi:hypothetical protein
MPEPALRSHDIRMVKIGWSLVQSLPRLRDVDMYDFVCVGIEDMTES